MSKPAQGHKNETKMLLCKDVLLRISHLSFEAAPLGSPPTKCLYRSPQIRHLLPKQRNVGFKLELGFMYKSGQLLDMPVALLQ